jgi:hypothetical protein
MQRGRPNVCNAVRPFHGTQRQCPMQSTHHSKQPPPPPRGFTECHVRRAPGQGGQQGRQGLGCACMLVCTTAAAGLACWPACSGSWIMGCSSCKGGCPAAAAPRCWQRVGEGWEGPGEKAMHTSGGNPPRKLRHTASGGGPASQAPQVCVGGGGGRRPPGGCTSVGGVHVHGVAQRGAGCKQHRAVWRDLRDSEHRLAVVDERAGGVEASVCGRRQARGRSVRAHACPGGREGGSKQRGAWVPWGVACARVQHGVCVCLQAGGRVCQTKCRAG